MKQVLDNLRWSEPRSLKTFRGVRSVQVAYPTKAFWAIWRADKAGVKALGIECVPSRDGWEVRRDAVAAEAPVAVAAVESVAEEVFAQREASRASNFVAPAIDASRSWSAEQIAIFDFFRSAPGNLVVMARAGTGKTTTIRVAFSQAPEASMLYAVFNKKNQIEAQAVISDARVDVKTLHALGYVFIKSFWPGVRPDDEVESYRAAVAAGADCPMEVLTQVKRLVAFAKNSFVAPSYDEMLDLADARGIECPEFDNWTVARIAKVAMKVLELSKVRDHEGRISFNDMVWLPVAKGWVHPMYDLVCVDEAQDMNLPQLLMARGSVRPGGRVIVVGDDRQAIYGFRGAAADGMEMMRRELNAAVLPLTITYRCPKAVVALAAAIVPDYRAADSAPEGEVLSMNADALHSILEVGDAVLSRANAPLMPLCLALLRKGLSARIEGRDIGKQLLAIVKKVNARSVPQFITKIENWGIKMKNRFAGSKHFESKAALIDDQVATLTAVAEGVSSVSEIETRLTSLFQDSDGNSKPAVVLSSVHKAKGLEWNRVCLLTDTFRGRPGQSEQAANEEQNIYYVALTRAKKQLVLAAGK